MARIKYKEAIGLEVKRGRPAKGNKPSEKILKKLYIKESRSIREIVNILGCSKDMVYRGLKEYGIERRTKAKRSGLHRYKLKYLERETKKNGFSQVANKLNVDVTTLRRYLNSELKK